MSIRLVNLLQYIGEAAAINLLLPPTHGKARILLVAVNSGEKDVFDEIGANHQSDYMSVIDSNSQVEHHL